MRPPRPPVSTTTPADTQQDGPAAARLQPRTAQAPATESAPDSEPSTGEQSGVEVLQQQAHQPADEHDVHYREQLLWSPIERDDAALQQLLLDQLATVQESFHPTSTTPTRDLFVQLALFDQHFEEEPEGPPLATLAWQSWESLPAEVWVRGQLLDADQPIGDSPDAEHALPTQSSPSSASPPWQPTEAVEQTLSQPLPDDEPTEPLETGEAQPPQDSTRPSKTSDPVPLTRIVTPQEDRDLDPTEKLLGRAFETMHKLLYCNTVGDGAQFVLSSLVQIVPSTGVLIHLFDVSTRKLLVVRAKGPKSETLLLTRTDPLGTHFDEALRRQETIKLSGDSRSNPYGLWTRLGVSLTHGLSSPILNNRRYLGALEVGRQQSEAPFSPAEVLTLEYITQQFADFLATHSVRLDDASLLPGA